MCVIGVNRGADLTPAFRVRCVDRAQDMACTKWTRSDKDIWCRSRLWRQTWHRWLICMMCSHLLKLYPGMKYTAQQSDIATHIRSVHIVIRRLYFAVTVLFSVWRSSVTCSGGLFFRVISHWNTFFSLSSSVYEKRSNMGNINLLKIFHATWNMISIYRLYLSLLDSFWKNKAHDDVIKWKHFPRYWSPVNSLHKAQWRRAFVFPLIC